MTGEYTKHSDYVSLEFEHWRLGVGVNDGQSVFRFGDTVYNLADEAALASLTKAVQVSMSRALSQPVLVAINESGLRHMASGAQEIVQSWVEERR